MLAGPLPSLLRASVSECASALARLSNRALDPVQSLAVAALLLLAWQPAWSRDLGFQLSFAATLGLVTLTEPLLVPFARWPRFEPLARPLAATCGAQLFALPILLSRFHALPWTGLGANLLAVPLAEMLLAASALGGAAEALLPGAGRPWLAACEPLARALREVATFAASLPHALLATGHAGWIAPVLAAGVLCLGLSLPAPRTLAGRAWRPSKRRRWCARSGIACCAAGLLGALLTRPMRPPPERWWLVAIDVGQGDALALAFADRWWLVDAGPRSPRWDAGEGAVLPFLRWAGVRELGLVAITHDDGDHTGGVDAVRRGARARDLVAPAPRPGVPGPCAKWPARAVGRGDTLRRDPLVRVLWPPRPGEPAEEISRRGDNAAALVLEVGEGVGRALLTADADSVVEVSLEVASGVAVLKAGHHGSGSSSGAVFTRRLAPAWVLVSCGRRNAYGHPNAGALARLGAGGAVIDRTDRSGAIWYELGTEGARVLAWKRHP